MKLKNFHKGLKTFLSFLMIWSMFMIIPETYSLEATETAVVYEDTLIENEETSKDAPVIEEEPGVIEVIEIKEESEADKTPEMEDDLEINSLSDSIASFGVTSEDLKNAGVKATVLQAVLEAEPLSKGPALEENEEIQTTSAEIKLALNYDRVAYDEALTLNLPENLVLENSITDVMHQNITFRGARTTLTQGIPGAHIAFSIAATIKIDNIQFNNIHAGTPATVAPSFNGVIAPAANSNVNFENWIW